MGDRKSSDLNGLFTSGFVFPFLVCLFFLSFPRFFQFKDSSALSLGNHSWISFCLFSSHSLPFSRGFFVSFSFFFLFKAFTFGSFIYSPIFYSIVSLRNTSVSSLRFQSFRFLAFNAPFSTFFTVYLAFLHSFFFPFTFLVFFSLSLRYVF